MKTEQLEALESYFTTENEHWNKYAFNMLNEVLQQGAFDDPEIPLRLFSNAFQLFPQLHDKPLQAFETFRERVEEQQLTTQQTLVVYNWVESYLKGSEFDQDLSGIKALVQSQRTKLYKENQPVQPLVKNLRDNLKDMVQQELDILPETLKELSPVQRLNILCKLIPFVLPKVEAIDSEKGEPGRW